ncbi:MAG: dTDP-4-dehydrorhamnose 3,5-epimerase [Bacteroidales bacterium]|nr:dTDP-4-dehydrorhamnose 3,5-epimerase [Bacteroidales bacterium]MBK8883043.1 dTDP-4-dehydrorhamnose 3,5-epimerase [Bacteroidales bacterium]
MKIIETGFKGLIVIKPTIFSDQRGYFFESFNHNTLEKVGISFTPVQDNESKSSKGVIRGLHYQLSPFGQAKMIRVVEGKIFDVALDLRASSRTFGKWFGIDLDSETKDLVLIPRGFAHGFSVLSETAIIQYKCDNVYNSMLERGIFLNDPQLDINWKTGSAVPIISEKDSKQPLFRDAEYNF